MARLKLSIFAFIILATFSAVSFAQIAVGTWRDHLSYSELFKVIEVDNQIWCSAEGGLFYYDLEDNTINRLNKTHSLSDVGISTFSHDPLSGNIVVAYSNSNIDILKEGLSTNISDIKRSNIGGSKKINNISFNKGCAYLACAFGIVVVDLNRHEIKETYYPGDNGTYMNINDIIFTDSLIVAATDSGIIYAPKDSRLLNIATNWNHDTSSLMAGYKVSRLVRDASGNIVALTSSENSSVVFRQTDGMNFVPWLTGNITNIESSHNKIVACYERSIETYDENYLLQDSLGTIDWLTMEANDAIIGNDGNLWIAHKWASLARVNITEGSIVQTIVPAGPGKPDCFRLTSFDKELMVAPGGHSTTFVGSFLYPNVYTLNSDKQSWSSLRDDDKLLNGVLDIIDVAVNPRNPKQKFAAAWNYGIVEINDNKVVNLWNGNNTDGVLAPYTSVDEGGNSYSMLRTGGVAFDNSGNAWFTNSLTQHVLTVRRGDGTWQNFDTHNMIGGGDIDHIIWDSINNLKLFWGHSNRIYVHDGISRMAYIDPNNGSRLQTSSISSLVQDHSGSLWMGTNKGIKVIYNTASAFKNGGNGEMSPITCNNIIFNANGITEYLMAYESVTCIAVDGANRKWVGTASGGLYLLSANGLEELEHFTSANSPLFSDKIVCLAIMPWTGELFIGTDKGLQSYRTTATYAFGEPMSDIHAFPNPVRSDYDGVISIKGFTRNGIIHITDANGNTVYSTRANGGQAIWDGRTNSGRRVASGVYYVFASAEDGSKRSVTKILFIK